MEASFYRGSLDDDLFLKDEWTLEELDSAFCDPAFQGFSLGKLALLTQLGDAPAKEELYERLNPEIIKISEILVGKYRYLENDEGVFYDAICLATERAVANYRPGKGKFTHFWRKIVKREKLRILKGLSQGKKPCLANTVSQENTLNPDFFDVLVSQTPEAQLDLDYIEEQYLKENASNILRFIDKHYQKQDCQMIEMWMDCYSLNEIASSLHLPVERIYSRLYTLLDSVRKNIDPRLVDFLRESQEEKNSKKKDVSKKPHP